MRETDVQGYWLWFSGAPFRRLVLAIIGRYRALHLSVQPWVSQANTHTKCECLSNLLSYQQMKYAVM